MPVGFEPLLKHVPVWLFVMFRLSGIFIFAPVFGSNMIPVRIKAFLALALSFCIYPILWTPGSPSAQLLAPALSANYFSLWTLGTAVAMELGIGLAIGYGASLPMVGIQLGGRAMDQQMGLGLAGVFNPEFEQTTGIVSEFMFLMALTIFVILGGHHVVLSILISSFDTIPPGGFSPNGELLTMLVGLFSTMFELALRVAAPLLCFMFLQTVVLGFIMRTVPQVNILTIGFPLRVINGAMVLIAAVVLYADAFVEVMRDTLMQLAAFFGN